MEFRVEASSGQLHVVAYGGDDATSHTLAWVRRWGSVVEPGQPLFCLASNANALAIQPHAVVKGDSAPADELGYGTFDFSAIEEEAEESGSLVFRSPHDGAVTVCSVCDQKSISTGTVVMSVVNGASFSIAGAQFAFQHRFAALAAHMTGGLAGGRVLDNDELGTISSELGSLLERWIEAAKSDARKIVIEESLPESLRLLPRSKVAGVLGGDKFVTNGIFYKTLRKCPFQNM